MLEGQNTPGSETAKSLNSEPQAHDSDNWGSTAEPDDSQFGGEGNDNQGKRAGGHAMQKQTHALVTATGLCKSNARCPQAGGVRTNAGLGGTMRLTPEEL